MTKEEAHKILRQKIFPCVIGEWQEAVSIAIKALETEQPAPCDDAVSRKYILEKIDKMPVRTSIMRMLFKVISSSLKHLKMF